MKKEIYQAGKLLISRVLMLLLLSVIVELTDWTTSGYILFGALWGVFWGLLEIFLDI